MAYHHTLIKLPFEWKETDDYHVTVYSHEHKKSWGFLQSYSKKAHHI
jgi:hypothetical protein